MNGASGTILVTGANGFVGRALTNALADQGRPVRCAVRARERIDLSRDLPVYEVGDIGARTDWSPVVEEVDAVVHLAARVHVMRESSPDPLGDYRRTNVEGTLGLAEAAATAGVRRFLFLSSVKVNGEATYGAPFRESDSPSLVEPYGRSKWEAEQGLLALGKMTGMEVVIVRPPLIYGPGVKANFLRLFRAVYRGLPLPLGSVPNRRSVLYLENLVEFLLVAIEHPGAAGETFLVADEPPVSTSQLIRAMGTAVGRPARLLPVPPGLIRVLGKAAGRTQSVERLLGSLVVDTTKARTVLGWDPPYSLADGLAATASWARTRRP